jgi:hypothetical protein
MYIHFVEMLCVGGIYEDPGNSPLGLSVLNCLFTDLVCHRHRHNRRDRVIEISVSTVAALLGNPGHSYFLDTLEIVPGLGDYV